MVIRVSPLRMYEIDITSGVGLALCFDDATSFISPTVIFELLRMLLLKIKAPAVTDARRGRSYLLREYFALFKVSDDQLNCRFDLGF